MLRSSTKLLSLVELEEIGLATTVFILLVLFHVRPHGLTSDPHAVDHPAQEASTPPTHTPGKEGEDDSASDDLRDKEEKIAKQTEHVNVPFYLPW